MAIRQVESSERLSGSVDAGMGVDSSDAELLSRFATDRDLAAEGAFTALVRRHGPMVFRVCRQIVGDRHTAEDAFQATFLILARRAGSIQQPELLGQWLHGVAFRTAREARMQQHRRQQRECAIAGALEPVDRSGRPDVALVCREELEALHEEVSRLPERYRVPVVLCDLEGLSYQDAAKKLGCPVGTIGVRLRRARQRLRARMARRGLAPTASLLASLLAPEAGVASPPALLVDSTVKAAMGFAASSSATAGLASTPVIALSERILRLMAFSRFKLAIQLGLAIGISVAVAWLARPQKATVGPVAPAQADAMPPRDAAEKAHERTGIASATQDARTATAEERAGVANATQDARTATAVERTGHEIANVPRMYATSALAELPDDVFAPDRTPEGWTAHNMDVAMAGTVAPAQEERLAREERARGAILFSKEWMPDDSKSHGGDGLGPVFNATSCVACHGLGAPGGAGPESKNVVLITVSPNGCGPVPSPERIHPGFRGSKTAILHRYGTDPEYAAWLNRFFAANRGRQANVPAARRDDSVEGRIQALKEQTSPERRIRELSAGERSMNGASVSVSERNTPPLFGVGLIDEIPSEVLMAVAARQPAAIRGRVNRTKEGRIGRFGSKAQIPTLHEFVRGACANELGLEVPGHSQGVSPLAPDRMAKGLDLTEPDCDDLVAYVRALPAPEALDLNGLLGTADMRTGRRLFAQVGCASCHVPKLGDVEGIFSDLLLHNMGQSLSDQGSAYGSNRPDSSDEPSPREWRTAPLWGYRDSGPYMHDGRARTLDEAVAMHEGQGKASAHQFFRLASKERGQVEAFLKSLIAPGRSGAAGPSPSAELAARVEPEGRIAAETRVRQEREEVSARDEERFQQALRKRRAQEAARRARAQIPLARSLEKMGKITGAIAFYQEIAREASGTKEGRLAEVRISELMKAEKKGNGRKAAGKGADAD
jgi:RNA polymerase sigma factor (sigma-70 family)